MSSLDEAPSEVKDPEAMRARIAEAIRNSPQRIEEELAKSPNALGANAWLACYNSRLQLLYMLVERAQGVLPESEIDSMVLKLGLIGTELAGLRDPQLNDVMHPPENV